MQSEAELQGLLDRRTTGKPLDQPVMELMLLASMALAFLLIAIYFAVSWLEQVLA